MHLVLKAGDVAKNAPDTTRDPDLGRPVRCTGLGIRVFMGLPKGFLPWGPNDPSK